jgi:TldD protein
MTRSTRRDFLATTSLAVAGLALGNRPAGAQQQLSRLALRSSNSANALLPEAITPLELQTLALHAVDAARSAGAMFADVRVSELRELRIEASARGVPALSVQARYMYGVRASTGGPMAFVHGVVPTVDAMTAAARQAVHRARGYATVSHTPFVLAPTPVVTGEWTTPIKIDPFAVPLVTQADLMHALADAANRVLGTSSTSTTFFWQHDLRVFASTEGSLVTQERYCSRPRMSGLSNATFFPGESIHPPHFPQTVRGYESVLLPDLQEQIKSAAEEARALASLPVRTFDVGKVPLIVDGFSMGALVGQTVGRALEADRVLGHEEGVSGGSYLTPPTDVIGQTVLNPLLTIVGNRAPPSVLSAKWDDEGVAPEEFTLLAEGRVVDYCTSRGTAGALHALSSASRQFPPRSHGCAVADLAQNPVQVRTPHLYLAPNRQDITLEALYRDVRHGLLMQQCDYVEVDANITTGTVNFARLYEIRNGKIIGRVRDSAIIFNTLYLWRSLAALGGRITERNYTGSDWKGMPWRSGWQSINAPAARFNAIDVISTGQSLS